MNVGVSPPCPANFALREGRLECSYTRRRNLLPTFSLQSCLLLCYGYSRRVGCCVDLQVGHSKFENTLTRPMHGAFIVATVLLTHGAFASFRSYMRDGSCIVSTADSESRWPSMCLTVRGIHPHSPATIRGGMRPVTFCLVACMLT